MAASKKVRRSAQPRAHSEPRPRKQLLFAKVM